MFEVSQCHQKEKEKLITKIVAITLLMVTEVMSVSISDPPLSYTNENENIALLIFVSTQRVCLVSLNIIILSKDYTSFLSRLYIFSSLDYSFTFFSMATILLWLLPKIPNGLSVQGRFL